MLPGLNNSGFLRRWDLSTRKREPDGQKGKRVAAESSRMRLS